LTAPLAQTAKPSAVRSQRLYRPRMSCFSKKFFLKKIHSWSVIDELKSGEMSDVVDVLEAREAAN
jgi:hypothetical protein